MLKLECDVDLLILWCTILLSFIAITYVLLDVNYFLRVFLTILWGKLFEKKITPDKSTTIYGFCFTNDIDIVLKHMNNARYVRELDFARFHFYERSGIYNKVREAKGDILQTASNIRYRRTIPLLTAYKVTTKLIYWDEKCLYLEQQFVTLTDNFIRAVAFSKQQVVGPNVREICGQLLGKDSSYQPEPLPELMQWIKSMEMSSERLKKKD